MIQTTAAPNLFYGTSGPRDARIAIVGESWGREELAAKQPFVGASGAEFRRMLREAGLRPEECFMTNVCPRQPLNNEMWRFFHDNSDAKNGAIPWKGLFPHTVTAQEIQNLLQQLTQVAPDIVIAAGNYALWALSSLSSISSISTGGGATIRVPTGIMSWRGSMCYLEGTKVPLLPIIHPAAILRAWYLRAVTVQDLRERVPKALNGGWSAPIANILAPPTFEQAVDRLRHWADAKHPRRLACDIETYKRLISVIGFADSATSAISIPLIRMNNDKTIGSWWSPDNEVSLYRLIRKIFSNPNIILEGQNFIYDLQYLRRYLAINAAPYFDTMLAHHLLFPGTPKGLDYLSSIYCDHHVYWKDDGKEWDSKHLGFERLLQYNAIDVMRTFECATVLRKLISKEGMDSQWEFEQKKALLAFHMMNRGIAVDVKRRSQFAFDLLTAQTQIHSELEQIAPPNIVHHLMKNKTRKPWYASSRQTLHLFEILGLPLQHHRKTGNPTVDAQALSALRSKAPEWTRLFNLLEDERSVDVFASTFIRAPLDSDGRMRCSFNIAGTETFRWSSSENAFGSGTNLQNIPKNQE